MAAQAGRLHRRQHSGRVSAVLKTGGQQTRAKTRRLQARPLGRMGGRIASSPQTTALVSGASQSCLYILPEHSQPFIASTVQRGSPCCMHAHLLGTPFTSAIVKRVYRVRGRRSSRVAPAPDALGLRAMIDASADSACLADSGTARPTPACAELPVTAGQPHVTLLSLCPSSAMSACTLSRKTCPYGSL